MIQIIALISIVLCVSFGAQATEAKIEAYKAPFYVSETVMACGTISQVTKGKKANYLNLDKQYPNQTLTIVIWDKNQKGFEQRFGVLTELENKRVCARGKITEYKNSLQIKVTNPQFLRLMN